MDGTNVALSEARVQSPRPLRILLVITTTAGGAGLQALHLARYLSRDAVDLTIMFGPGYPLDVEFDRLDLPIRRISLERSAAPLPMVKGFFQITAELRRRRYDAVCCICSAAGMVGRLAGVLAGVRHRILIVQAFASRPFQPVWAQRFYRIIERALEPLTTSYVAVSEAGRQFGVNTRVMAPQKVTVIHNGVEATVDPDMPSTLRSELGLTTQPIIGFMGRLEEQKGLCYLLDAAPGIRQAVPDAKLVIVGDGPLMAETKARIAASHLEQMVHLVGWRTDTFNVLAGFDIFCLPSLWEQFPLVVLEAMMVRRPVVATSVDGVPEAVLDGTTGLLVPPANPDALTTALVALLKDPGRAKRMGEAGCRHVTEHFTVAAMIDKYEQFFGRLMWPADTQIPRTR